MPSHENTAWPPLPYDAWRETCATLQLWTQIVGKIRLARAPWMNHSWHVALYVTSRGLSTSPIPFGARTAELIFDFIDHTLRIEVSDGRRLVLPLKPQSVAVFFASVMSVLDQLGLAVAINEHPCEIPNAIAFSDDRVHNAYDAEWAHRFWLALVQIDRVFKQFRSGFLGKVSPVHFFWGSFDLAVTRFSGRRAPAFSGTVPGVHSDVMCEAYSHEVSSAGFWPGGNGVDASFYSYAYPVPQGFKDCAVLPGAASFNEKLGEFLLPYEAVRNSDDPDATLLSFLETTYRAAADVAKWDRTSLECAPGKAGVPRDWRS